MTRACVFTVNKPQHAIPSVYQKQVVHVYDDRPEYPVALFRCQCAPMIPPDPQGQTIPLRYHSDCPKPFQAMLSHDESGYLQVPAPNDRPYQMSYRRYLSSCPRCSVEEYGYEKLIDRACGLHTLAQRCLRFEAGPPIPSFRFVRPKNSSKFRWRLFPAPRPRWLVLPGRRPVLAP